MTQLLQATVFFLYIMPPLLCGNLRCFFTPLLEKEHKYEPVATECPPDEVCFKADGRYGNYSALKAMGCMPKKVCSQTREMSYKGVFYTMSYACCSRPYCNTCVGLKAAAFSVTLTFVAVVMIGCW
uniref:protein Bouncer n=1 Tax=Doryrhamphus excisus TaxID=161450 RepID=UPI0025ADE902|nr:protein Bouncer [Doryrhamphus excisus]